MIRLVIINHIISKSHSFRTSLQKLVLHPAEGAKSQMPAALALTLFYTERLFLPQLSFSWQILSETGLFSTNQLDFESTFITNNSWKFEIVKITERFAI